MTDDRTRRKGAGDDGDIKLARLAHALQTGGVTLAEAVADLERAIPRYHRPELDRVTFDLDRYADWEVRAQALALDMNELFAQLPELDRTDSGWARALRRLLASALRLLESGACVVLYELGSDAASLRLHDEEVVRECVSTLERLAAKNCADQSSRADYVDALRYWAECVDALRYLTELLLAAGRPRSALRRARELLHVSEQHELPAARCVALRLLSDAHERLGQHEPALAGIREAIKVRHSLTDREATDGGVDNEARLSHDLGLIARTLGHLDEAREAFQRAYEQFLAAGDYVWAALEASEIGFLFIVMGDDERGERHLRQAAKLAEEYGATTLARRWRVQLGERVHLDMPETRTMDVSREEAYARSASVFAQLGRRELGTARAELEWLIEWSQANSDQTMELSVRANLATVFDLEGDLFQAILKDRSAAHRALLLGNDSVWLQIQGNLANRYGRSGESGKPFAHRVVERALEQIDGRLRQTDSTDARQVIQAGAQRLYEYKVMLALADGNARSLVLAAEQARARNLTGWMAAERLLDGVTLSEAEHTTARALILKLRELETSAEEADLTGQITADRMRFLDESRAILVSQLRAVLVEHPHDAAALERTLRAPSFDWAETEQALVLEPEAAVLYLFGLPNGIAMVLIRASSSGTIERSGVCVWPRADRMQAVARRFRTDEVKGGRLRLTRHVGAGGSTQYESYLEQLQVTYLPKLVELFQNDWPRYLAVIPHRELQLIPHEELLRLSAPETCVTIAPSLRVLTYCLSRRQTAGRATVLLVDETGELRWARDEANMVERVRGGAMRPESVEELLPGARDANVIHVAAHGIFDPANPYRSGVVVFSDDPRAAPTLTVADVLGRLELRDCQLVVLSACESGVARQHPSDEYTGLPASFLLAGARTVIATRWPVADNVAWLLMSEFYALWTGGSGAEPSAARALHTARQRVRTMPRESVVARIGAEGLPGGLVPFMDPRHTVAFEAMGAW